MYWEFAGLPNLTLSRAKRARLLSISNRRPRRSIGGDRMLPDLAAASERVLSDYLRSEGFEVVLRERTQVEHARGDVLLAISYWQEDPSPRPLMVGLGIMHPSGRSIFALDSLAPDSDRRPGLTHGRFADQDDLEQMLTRVRDTDLRERAAPLWHDPGQLVHVVQKLATAHEAEYERGVAKRQLVAARLAFTDGRFQSSIDSYVMAGGGLSAADEQRLKIARRRVAPDMNP